MNFKTFIERYGGARDEVAIFYHGTRGQNFDPNTRSPKLASILSQGLIPIVKKRTWDVDSGDFNSPSRASLDGVYVSNNLMTAVSSASYNKERGESEIIVALQIQPRSLLADEDHTTSSSHLSVSKRTIDINPYMARQLFVALRTGDNGEFVRDAKNAYIERNIEQYQLKLDKPMHPQLRERLEYLLGIGFEIAVNRKVSHINADDWRLDHAYQQARQKHPHLDLSVPDPRHAEKEYRKYADQLSRTLKHIARPQPRTSGLVGANGRLLQPIGYDGTNKILCILESFPGNAANNYKTHFYIRYGSPPGQLIRDWTQRMGEWAPSK